MSELTKLARDEQECIEQMLHGIDLLRDRARQLHLQFRPHEKGWLDFAMQMDNTRKIMIALISMKAKPQQAFLDEIRRGQGKPPRQEH